MLKVLIIDEDRSFCETLKILLETFLNDIYVIGTAPSVTNSLSLLENDSPDLVFLDIRLKNDPGFEYLNKFKSSGTELVFTSDSPEYAIFAIKFSAFDYLLKPIKIEELKATIDKAERKKENAFHNKFEFFLQNYKVDPSINFKLVLPTSGGLMFFKINDLIYCEASNNYTIFYMKDGQKYVTSKTLKEYEDLLLPFNFFRIHHSFLVNLGEIKKYIKGEGGTVVMSNENSLYVSKRKKDAFLNKLSLLTISSNIRSVE